MMIRRTAAIFAATAIAVTASAATASAASHGHDDGDEASTSNAQRFTGSFVDYDTATASPFDTATARVNVVQSHGKVKVDIQVRNLTDVPAPAPAKGHGKDHGKKPAAAVYQARLFGGSCATEIAAGTPTDPFVAAGPATRKVSNEVRLTLVPKKGRASADTKVSALPAPGEHSLIVFAAPNASGVAAPVACFPLTLAAAPAPTPES